MELPWHQLNLSAVLARRGGLPHAFLIRGPEGIGKYSFARALAQALLCERAEGGQAACGKCEACGWFVQGSHPDFRLLEPLKAEESGEPGEGREKKGSTHIEVDQVRALVAFINLSTHRGGARVIILQPADALNVPAANALLKSLEEPPAQTYFLLVAHRWHHLLPTIRSRCQQLPLQPPAQEAAGAWLAEQGVRNPELALAHAGGAPLLAAQYDEDYWQARQRLYDRLASRQFDALSVAEELRDTAPAMLVTLLQKWSHDLALHQACGSVRYNPDRAAALGDLAARLDRLETARFHRRMARLQRIVLHPLNARLFLEDVLLDCGGLLQGAGFRRAA